MLLSGFAVAAVVLIPIGWAAGRAYQRHTDGWARWWAHRQATRGIRRAAIRATGDALGVAALAVAFIAFGLFLLLTKGH